MDTPEMLHLSHKLDALAAQITELKIEQPSPSYDLIAAGLAEAQREFKPITPTKHNPYQTFYTINDIVQATKESLASNGLKVVQYTHGQDSLSLTTLLLHKSGQSISSSIRLVKANTDVEFEAHLDFHRKKQMELVLGIDASNSDDHGFAQYESKKIKNLKSGFTADPVNKAWEPITKEQYQDILDTLEEYPEIAKEVMDKYGIETLADMPKHKFPDDMKYIRHLIYKTRQ